MKLVMCRQNHASVAAVMQYDALYVNVKLRQEEKILLTC